MSLIPMEQSIHGNTLSLVNNVVAGYISGSGNYTILFIPQDIDRNKTVDITINSLTIFFNGTTISYDNNNFDTSYKVVTKSDNGLSVELKFRSTKTANTPITGFLGGTITSS